MISFHYPILNKNLNKNVALQMTSWRSLDELEMNLSLVFHVQRSRGFVQQENGGVFQRSSGNRNSLPFAARKIGSFSLG